MDHKSCDRGRAPCALLRAWHMVGRAAAWLLVPLLLLQFLSGYAIMHPRLLGSVMGKMTAFQVHTAVQPVTMAAFVLHGFPWIRRRLAKRWAIPRVFDAFLLLLGAALVAASTYLWSIG